MSPTGRPEGEHRSAKHEGSPVSPTGRPEGEHRSAKREGSPVSLRRRFRLVAAVALAAAAFAGHAAEMRPFDAASLPAIKAAYAGRSFILAFWSIHCAPCIEDLADWGPLQRRHPGVPIVLVTTDPPAERARVARVLARYPLAKVEAWAFADDFGERIRYAVDRGWRGELPRTYFYDAAHAAEVVSGRLDAAWTAAWYDRVR